MLQQMCRPLVIGCCGVATAVLIAAPFLPALADKNGFRVTVLLSEQASITLSAKGETIIVDASYSGEPKPSAERYANEIGSIDLGSEKVEIPETEDSAYLNTAVINPDRKQWIDGPVNVNVNVYSGRKSSPDNLLSCDFIDGDLSNVIATTPISLNCALIEEEPDTVLRP